MLDHLAILCRDLSASASFYDAVLPALGVARLMVHPQSGMGYGTAPKPDFWLQQAPPELPQREVHIAFAAPDRTSVRAFYDAAVAAGGRSLHAPRVWPEYHANYYGAFVRDLDGNNVEAVCHSAEGTVDV